MNRTLVGLLVLASLGVFPTGWVVAASKDEIQRKTDEVFSRPEFHPPEPSNLRWFFDAIFGLFQWLATLSDERPTLFVILLIVSLIVLALLLGHITWTVYRVFYVGRRAATPSVLAEQRRQARRFREEATTAAAAGDYTAAVRLLFLSLLYAFEERGSLLLRPALTNREYLATIGDRRELRRDLAVFVDLLDDNWYGQQATTREQYDDCEALYSTLQQRG